jgi:hypothetical protein
MPHAAALFHARWRRQPLPIHGTLAETWIDREISNRECGEVLKKKWLPCEGVTRKSRKPPSTITRAPGISSHATGMPNHGSFEPSGPHQSEGKQPIAPLLGCARVQSGANRVRFRAKEPAAESPESRIQRSLPVRAHALPCGMHWLPARSSPTVAAVEVCLMANSKVADLAGPGFGNYTQLESPAE